MEEVKPPYLSKTILVNSLVAVAGAVSALGFIPQVHAFLTANVDMVLSALGLVGIGLRLVTKGKIELY